MKVNNPNYLNGLTVSAEQINAAVEGGGTSLTTEQIAALERIEGLQSSAGNIDNMVVNGATQADLDALALSSGNLTAEQIATLANIEGMSATSSEIEENVSFYNNNLKNETTTNYNGINSTTALDDTYTLSTNGDYLEFIGKWNDDSVDYLRMQGLFGTTNTTAYNQTIGLYKSFHQGDIVNQIGVRGSGSYMYLDFTQDPFFYHKYKVLVNGTDLELWVDDLLQDSIALNSSINIANIGNTYSTYFVNANIKEFTISTSLNNVTSSDIHNDSRFTNNNTTSIEIDRNLSLYEKPFYLKVKFNGSDEFTILKPQANGNYIAYTLQHRTDGINADNWTIGKAYEATFEYELLTELTRESEWETAIKILNASDYMGGQLHGNEQYTYAVCLIDGVATELNTSFDIECTTFEFIQKSNLLAPAPLVNQGTVVATSNKIWQFNSSKKNKLKQRIKWNTVEKITVSYLFMLPIYRNNLFNENITHSAITSNDYVLEDTLNIDSAEPYYVGTKFGLNTRQWGDKFAACVDVISGWQDTSIFNILKSSTYNKMYFSYAGNGSGNTYTTSVNEEFILETDFDVLIKDKK